MSKYKVLIVEDRKYHRLMLRDVLSDMNLSYDSIPPIDETMEEVKLKWVMDKIESDNYALLILDLAWNENEHEIYTKIQTSPDNEIPSIWTQIKKEGKEPQVIKLLKYLDQAKYFMPVIILSSWSRAGSFFQKLELLRAKRVILEKPKMSREKWRNLLEPYILSYMRAKEVIEAAHNEFIGDDLAWIETLSIAKQYAESEAPILITGETGIGKSKLARVIHAISNRNEKGEFIDINIAAQPRDLIGSILFGHIKGAFTGAFDDKKGLLEESNKGTLFMDEIGDLPIDQQIYLLNALQEKEIHRVGDTRKIKLDIRYIFATRRNLRDLIIKNRFRDDLYYRVRVLPLELTPLRFRKQDIPLFATHFLQKYSSDSFKYNLTVTSNDIPRLMEYNFPGNIRQLESIVQRAIALNIPLDKSLEKYEEEIEQPLLKCDSEANLYNCANIGFSWMQSEGKGFKELIREYEMNLLKIAKAKSTSIKQAAKTLGIPLSTFENKWRQYFKKEA